jgi:hypothetical protein
MAVPQAMASADYHACHLGAWLTCEYLRCLFVVPSLPAHLFVVPRFCLPACACVCIALLSPRGLDYV